MADSKRLAFVPPRYGDEVVGGSEALMREAAHGLAARGWEVDVLTTCARDHYTWANAYPAGEFEAGGVRVRRFPTVHDTDPMAADAVLRRILVGVPVSPEEERTWLTGFFRVPELYQHLLAHGHEYRAVILSPYLFWTTVVGATACPERTVVIPCLHDESFAYLSIFRPVLSRVSQVWFLSEPEHELAHRLGPVAPDHSVVGCGVVIPDRYDPERFRARHGLGSRPFVLYAGRREAGKGWDDLIRGYTTAVTRLGVDIDLVTIGVGSAEPPKAVARRVIDLGFVPEEEVGDAFAAATAYLQPSPNESFSRTVMEAWLAGTPVIASAAGAVVRWHCERSGAGIVYRDDDELAECLALAADAPDRLAALARRGREYVLTNYTWDAVLDRMESALAGLP
jgi:glycosyltransferase involved in cell wall biosynthesis